MDKEKAIRNINALNAICGQKPFYDNEFEEALGMAIEALENQLTKEEAIYLIECLGGHTARCGVKDISIKCMDKLCKIKELKNDDT